MLFGTQVLPMIVPLATLAGRPLLPRQQPGQPQPTVSPSGGTDARGRSDRRLDSLPGALTVTRSRLH